MKRIIILTDDEPPLKRGDSLYVRSKDWNGFYTFNQLRAYPCRKLLKARQEAFKDIGYIWVSRSNARPVSILENLKTIIKFKK